MDFRPSLTVLVAWALALGNARAESWGVVHVGGTCMPAGTSLPSVLRVLRAELSPKLVTALEAGQQVSTADVVVTIDYCTEAPPGARINVWRDGVWFQRVIPLTDATSDTRDRTLSLLIAETLNAPPMATPENPGRPSGIVSRESVSAPRHDPAVPERTDERSTLPLALRGGFVGRFMPRTSTLLGGLDLGVSWRGLGLGAIALGATRSAPIGTVTLAAVAGEISYDVFDVTRVLKIRSTAELGAAIARGSPSQVATGRVVTARHAGLTIGIASLIPLEARWSLEAFFGGGYASSFTARVDGGDTLALDGWFLTALLGPRFQ
jgi:hypothetical protein